MLKRIISVILVSCLIMGLAVGCGGDKTDGTPTDSTQSGTQNEQGGAADEVSHLSERGCYLAACVWAQFLYKDEIDVRTNTFTEGATKKDREKLAEFAYQAVMG